MNDRQAGVFYYSRAMPEKVRRQNDVSWLEVANSEQFIASLSYSYHNLVGDQGVRLGCRLVPKLHALYWPRP